MGIGDSLYNLKWLFGGMLKKFFGKIKLLWAIRQAKVGVIVFACLLVLVPLISVIVAKSYYKSQEVKPPPAFVFEKISEDQLFIPDEPDFLPEVIFEKEQRQSWTKEELQEFWSPPSENPDQLWKDKITDSLDELLEHIP
ncbi:MAG: hypothetical protein Ta2B_04920 [Termitinemataceae bacterium]|nr:MAG: hypothetical protein Ta2B_04920 [Termitinemataceae bacterium]